MSPVQPTVIQTKRGPVECAISGEGRAVLAIHGAMGGYDQSDILARATLGREPYKTIAISRPGYLGTPLASGPTPEEQADRCADLLQALSIPDVAIVAISGGGQCALQFALRHPGRCRALVMISACSAPIHVPIPFRFNIVRLMARWPALLSLMPRAAPPATITDPESRGFMAELQATTTSQLSRRMPGTENDIRESRKPFDYPLEQIKVPVLVIHGLADSIAPVAQAQSLADRVPGAQRLLIEGGEHIVLFSHRAEIQQRIRAFLNR